MNLKDSSIPLAQTPEPQSLTEHSDLKHQKEVDKAEQLLKQQIDAAQTLSYKLSGEVGAAGPLTIASPVAGSGPKE